jgi:hypothetical protein
MNGLKILVTLNLGLLGCLAFVLTIRPNGKLHSVPDLKSSKAEPNSFCWSQLQPATNNYRAYIANLRAVGCPEPTIFDIIKGDADRAFAGKRQELHLRRGEIGPWSEESEIKLVTTSLGLEAPIAENANSDLTAHSPEPEFARVEKNPVTAISAAPQRPGQGGYTAMPPRYPLVFQDINTDALGLNEARKAVIRQIQQQFTDDVSGNTPRLNDPVNQAAGPATQDRSSPEDFLHWNTAQQAADDMLRGTLGTQEYLEYEYQHYFTNFQNQILNSGDTPLIINPDQLAR